LSTIISLDYKQSTPLLSRIFMGRHSISKSFNRDPTGNAANIAFTPGALPVGARLND